MRNSNESWTPFLGDERITAMRISSYSFGKITVDGQTYSEDLIIFPDRVVPSWWRQQGHSLSPDDLEDVIDSGPDVIVVGTGYSGVMKVPEETVSYLESRGMEVQVKRTQDAVKAFNESPDDKKVIAALHLTC